MKPAIVILDATSPIGLAVVQSALELARAVIAVAREPAALVQLQASHPRADLTVLAGDFASDADAIARQVRALRRPLAGVVVAGSCDPTRGRVLDAPKDAVLDVLARELLPHQAAARALIPLLAEGDRNGTYVVLGGPGGDQPWAGYGTRSIAAAATRMLVRVLHDEARPLGVRVQMLAVDRPIRTDADGEHACAHWPSALAIAARALALIDQVPAHPVPEPIVRYALQAPPLAPDRRAIHARRPAPQPPRVHDPTANDAMAGDAGALIRSLLNSDNEKA
jgi:NAD(P)-dependent dehydrogenase (short-subunit alcohol dehydrogenase family)